YYKTQTAAGSSTWSSTWTSLGGPVRANTDPVVIANSDGRLQVFVIGTNNQIYYRSQTAAAGSSSWTSSWTSLGGAIREDTSPAVARNNDGRVQVFMIGTDNALYYKTQTAAGSSTWSSTWTSLGGSLRDNSDPKVVPIADGRLDAFAISLTSSPNQPPIADSKSITTGTNTPVDITLSGSDSNNDPITFSIVDQPANGTLSSITTQNTVRYTPTTGYNGPDSFTYVDRDSKGATSINKATVSITVSNTDSGTNDKFGIKKIYPTKPGGEEWYMNMQDPNNDPRSKPPSISKNADGSWRISSGQVRYGVYTSSGYHPDQVVKDHSVLATRGYMQSPNDWKNIEMTGQVKYNSGGDDEWTWYARGGRHTSDGWPDGCEGSAYKGSLAYTGGQVRWAKEQWHVSYVFQPWKNSPADGDGKFVGFKTIIYNMQLNGKTVVKMETYVDPNNDNQWQKVYDFIDQGGWGNADGECKGASDQIITWGGPTATFRWDNGNSIDIKNLSVREIVPPT
ncbi:MAG: Ig-like domain-containing protein, partial [Nitrososphaeraceae archaeon]